MSRPFGMSHTKRAFLVAPVGASIVLTAYAIFRHTAVTRSTGVDDVLVMVLIFTLMSYLGAFAVGIPIFLLLRRVSKLSTTACASGGAVGGFIFFCLPYSLWYGLVSTLRTRTSELVVSTIAGALSGLIFDQVRRRWVSRP